MAIEVFSGAEFFHSNVWIQTNPVLRSAVIGYETDTGKIKVGDGVTTWNLLVYSSVDGSAPPPNGTFTIFVSRTFATPPTADDFTLPNFITDGQWHDLTLSAIVPAGAKAVLFLICITDNVAGSVMRLRKKGQTDEYNITLMRTQVINSTIDYCELVECDVNRIIQYNFTNTVWTAIDMVVRGWWV